MDIREFPPPFTYEHDEDLHGEIPYVPDSCLEDIIDAHLKSTDWELISWEINKNSDRMVIHVSLKPEN